MQHTYDAGSTSRRMSTDGQQTCGGEQARLECSLSQWYSTGCHTAVAHTT